jgi:3-hydroxyacyl-CoA dehydrogenase
VEINHIAVIGAGTMGSGIAQVCATSGYRVTLVDILPAQLERAMATIASSVEKLYGKGRLSDEQRRAAKQNITTANALSAAAEADLVIEAVVEDLEVKRRTFAGLDELTRADVILPATPRRSRSLRWARPLAGLRGSSACTS